MQEMIGKGTGPGKAIHRGLAKSDDPILKEGWTITLHPSGRRPSTPSGGSEAEADAIRDAVSGNVIRCPHCHSAQECRSASIGLR
jgi:hypothetical protein